MSQVPPADARPDVGSADSSTSGHGSGLFKVLTALLVVVLVAALVFAVTAYRQHRSDQAAATDRSRALSVAEQFTLRLDSLNYQDIPGYEKRLSALLTTKMRSDFSDTFGDFEKVYSQLQFASTGKVQSAGISDIDADSATVLVIHDVDVTSRGCVQPPYKRMTVDLRKVQGRWLVDDFAEGVPGCQG